jgi:3'(2'), 5'-bisphosphate nucleotidase
MENNPSNLAQKVLTIADQAGAILLRHFKTVLDVDYKQDKFDPVTVADRESDEFIRTQLQTLFPNDLVLSEESDSIPNDYSGRVWMVDPLNGTKSFVKGTDTFAVVIGLVENGVPILGCVTVPAQNKVFLAEIHKGAFEKVDGEFKRIHTSLIHDIEASCLITRESSNEVRPIEKKTNQLPFMKRIEGISGAKVCMIARGDADAHINTNFKASKWDIAAPQVILEEAGGMVTDLDGNPIDYKKATTNLERSYVASANNELHEKIIEKIRELHV